MSQSQRDYRTKQLKLPHHAAAFTNTMKIRSICEEQFMD